MDKKISSSRSMAEGMAYHGMFIVAVREWFVGFLGLRDGSSSVSCGSQLNPLLMLQIKFSIRQMQRISEID